MTFSTAFTKSLGSDDVGDSFTIDFNGFTGDGGVIDALGAKLTLTLKAITGKTYNFDYALSNTTDTSGGADARISSFAFNVDPILQSASSTGEFQYTVINGRYPNEIGNVDVCFKAKDNPSCPGGGGKGEGIFAGKTALGTLSLDLTEKASTLTLDDFFVRYQSVSGVPGVGSASGAQISSTSGGNDVPEPNMLLLFGAAALMVFVGTRRRRKVEDKQVSVAYS
ncbi:MAG: PEP-CTERM sorting domain-containing protein [Citromicrobium sp.]|nr:MAG: PEP-CTERM sorting domain-containing protein [Citromicrobium sp.]